MYGRSLVLVALAMPLGGCGGGKSDKPDPGSASGSTATTPPPAAAGGKFYPPKGPGPHDGFDLAAIHKKLQGSWLVGGTAFSSIPHVWSLDGDTLTQISEKGKRTTSTFRMLAPCYFVDGAPDGNSGTYGHFALDGDTLYLGLGMAGIVQGDKTIGCMAVGMYVLENGTCTRWTKKSFAKQGDEWEKEPGDCKYSDDKTKFIGDDTNSKRKIYGVETLNVKGSVLLTTQMEGNKAEKFPSLDAAIAKQKELIDAKTALTKSPNDLPFKTWGVESKDPAYASNAQVWAAAVTRDGKWALQTFRYKKFESDAVWVTGSADAWAPSAFVRAAATDLAPGPALLGIGAMLPIGRVDKVEGEKAKVSYWSYGRTATDTIDAARIRPLVSKAWELGAPLAVKQGSSWMSARAVLDAGGDAYVFVGGKVEKKPKTDLKLIDVGRRFGRGAKVWAAPPSGMSLAFVEGTVQEVHGDGLGYKIKAGDRVFDQAFDRVTDKL